MPRRLAVVAIAIAIAVGSGAVGALVWGSGSTNRSVAVRNLAYGVVDTFNRNDDATKLGVTDSGQRWFSVSGTWGVTGGTAYVARPGNGYNLSVVNMHTPDGNVQVTLKKLVAGAGLVFRYHNPFNYWLVSASPKLATWAVQRVENAKLVTVGDLGVVPVQDETTVSVRLSGPQITVAIDGQVRKSFVSGLYQGLYQSDTWAGLVGYTKLAGAARWSDFVASGAAPAPR